VLQGVIRNIGIGGVGIISNLPLTPGTVLRCDILLHEVPVRIPTILKVCWSAKSGSAEEYELGLLFVL
jgi:PilZ domain